MMIITAEEILADHDEDIDPGVMTMERSGAGAFAHR
jgi:hypothetical protein